MGLPSQALRDKLDAHNARVAASGDRSGTQVHDQAPVSTSSLLGNLALTGFDTDSAPTRLGTLLCELCEVVPIDTAALPPAPVEGEAHA